MAQATDYNLANQTGADFRAELNEILAASVSLNSGSSEPTTMYAHQLWVDTSSNVLKIRNAANNAWLTTGVSITASNTFDINAGTVNGITSLSFSSGATVASILDEDNLSSDSATALATQQSIKAYVDSQVTAQDLDISDGSSTIAIDLDSETLSLLGGTGITSTASGNGVTFAIGQSVGTSDNVVFNQVTGALVGNASTATTLATARTISGVSFDGSANITLDTDDVGEGSNKYFTAERVDDQVNTLLTAGANISLTYNDTAGTLTIANTNSADITSVVAGDGLTGGGTSGAVTLAVGVDDSSIEINSDALRVKASGITNAMLGGSIANAKLSNSSVTINSNSLSLGGTLTLDTDDIGEGSSNLYYTDARANSAIDARVTNTFINNLSGVVADTATALATARTIALSGDVAGSVSFDGTSDVTISSTIQANSVALGTDTVGNYVATITGTANKVSVSGSGSETAGVTLSLPDDVQIADSLTVAGNLTVNGDLTYLDTTNLKIEDNLFELNANLTGSPVNDSGMLINRGNQNNGIFMWDESADKFTIGLTTADGTSTGNITLASLGTLVANLEGNVTGTIQTAAQGNITSLGTLTALTVDDITINGSTISDAGDLTLDVAGDILLDADGGDVFFKDGGSTIAIAKMDSSNFTIQTNNNDKDIIFKGYDSDGGGLITALTLDMSNAGAATFNSSVATDTLQNASGNLNILSTNSVLIRFDSDNNQTDREFNIQSNNSTQLFKIDENGAMTHSGTASFAGVVTASAGVVVDNITIDGQEIDVSSGDLTLDVAGDINLDADGGDIQLKDAGVPTGRLGLENGDLNIASMRQDYDIKFKGMDGNTTPFTALTLDMSDAGTAIFNHDVKLGDNDKAIFGAGSDLQIFHDQSNSINYIQSFTSNELRLESNGNTTIRTNNGDNMAVFTKNGAATLYHDNNPKLATTSTGIDVTGTATMDSLIVDGGGSRQYINSGHLRLSDDYNIEWGGGTNAITGSNANNSILFKTNGSERAKIDSSGNVGIGTTSPSTKLHLGGTAPGDSIIRQDSTSSGTNWEIGERVAGKWQIFEDDGDSIVATFMSTGNVGIGTTSPAQTLHVSSSAATSNGIRISNSEGSFEARVDAGEFYLYDVDDNRIPFLINTSGNVGIGTTSPSNALDVQTSAGKFSVEALGGGSVRLASNGSMGMNVAAGYSYEIDVGGSEVMRIDSSGNVGIGTSSPATPLHIESTSIPQLRVAFDGSNYQNISYEGSDIYGGSQTFKIAGSEKMRLDTSGNLLVGKTTTAFDTQGIRLEGSNGKIESTRNGNVVMALNRLSSDGTIVEFAKDGTTVGSISVTSSATAYNTSSDARLKDVTGEARGLEVINELNPVAYNWKADGKADEGLIAQEVLDIVPNAVSGSEEDMYQMDYSKLVVHLVKAVQELKAEIDELKGE